MSLDHAKRRLLFRQIEKAPSCSDLPWLKQTDTFSQQCSRCEQCITACPNQIIIQGDGGFPQIDFRLGECSLCYRCAKACPESLFRPEATPAWTQVAEIVLSQCLAANGVFCGSCKDSCELNAIGSKPQLGGSTEMRIKQQECNSCGACVSVCPSNAIQIKVL